MAAYARDSVVHSQRGRQPGRSLRNHQECARADQRSPRIDCDRRKLRVLYYTKSRRDSFDSLLLPLLSFQMCSRIHLHLEFRHSPWLHSLLGLSIMIMIRLVLRMRMSKGF